MNRHLKTAFFIAPVLALIAYALTGYFASKPNQAAGTYELKISGSCKPVNGSCLLHSGNLELKLIGKQKKGKLQLAIIANQKLDNLSVALAENDLNFHQFKLMKSNNKKYWQLIIGENQILDSYTNLRLACLSKQSNYFKEIGIQFNGN